jgi:hypothetical protein
MKKAAQEKREVWEGKRQKTSSGLSKGDLIKNKAGKVVSKKQYKKGQELYKKMKREGRLATPFRSKSSSRSKSSRRR